MTDHRCHRQTVCLHCERESVVAGLTLDWKTDHTIHTQMDAPQSEPSYASAARCYQRTLAGTHSTQTDGDSAPLRRHRGHACACRGYCFVWTSDCTVYICMDVHHYASEDELWGYCTEQSCGCMSDRQTGALPCEYERVSSSWMPTQCTVQAMLHSEINHTHKQSQLMYTTGPWFSVSFHQDKE